MRQHCSQRRVLCVTDRPSETQPAVFDPIDSYKRAFFAFPILHAVSNNENNSSIIRKTTRMRIPTSRRYTRFLARACLCFDCGDGGVVARLAQIPERTSPHCTHRFIHCWIIQLVHSTCAHSNKMTSFPTPRPTPAPPFATFPTPTPPVPFEPTVSDDEMTPPPTGDGWDEMMDDIVIGVNDATREIKRQSVEFLLIFGGAACILLGLYILFLVVRYCKRKRTRNQLDTAGCDNIGNDLRLPDGGGGES